MKKVSFSLAWILLFVLHADAQTYYVSTAGSDLYPGTIDSPFASITRPLGLAVPGTVIYVRGGTYPVSSTITISRSGKADTLCSLLSYPGERAVLDCSSMPAGSTYRGVQVNGSNWHIKGFDILRAHDNGMFVRGSGNIVENCTFVGNLDTGLQLGNGASNNRVINCDSFDNADPGQGNADGFAPKLDVGTGNYFYGCRSWQNSDDGWDGYLRGANDVTTTLVNCWSFSNGYLSTGAPSSGNGNGFKLGGSDTANLKHNMVLKDCLVFDNRVKGYDQNHTRGSITLLNCAAYGNGSYNFSVPETLAAGKILTVENCISVGSSGVTLRNPVLATNSWMSPFTPPSASDFVSLDTTGVRGPRQPDGSLPYVPFMHLAPGSQYINAGTDVGLPYLGSAPDLGPFESDYPDGVGAASVPASTFALFQNYPNPFNPKTEIRYSVPPLAGRDGQVSEVGKVELRMFDVLGRKVATLVNGVEMPGTHEVIFDGSALTSGVYFYRLKAGRLVETRSMILMK